MALYGEVRFLGEKFYTVRLGSAGLGTVGYGVAWCGHVGFGWVRHGFIGGKVLFGMAVCG